MRLVHISDVHVQVDYRRLPWRRFGWRRVVAQLELAAMGRARLYEGSLSTLRQLVRDALALGADHVVLTGDLTALALGEEFEGAKDALGPLLDDPMRFTVIPGNHDRYTAHSVRDRRFESHFGRLLHSDLPGSAVVDLYPFVRFLGDHLAVVGLDSTRLAPVPGLSFGRVGREQLAALARVLDAPALAGRAVCVLVHHAPLHRDGRPDRLSHGLLDGGALLGLLAGRPGTLHHGHVHHRYWLPAKEGRPHVFNAGSSTQRGDEGFFVLDFDGPRLVSARAERPSRLPGPEPCPVRPEGGLG